MTKLYRILGKRGRITIPYEMRKRVGFTYNDVLSFTEATDGKTVIVKREKICDNCNGARKTDTSGTVTLLDFLNSLSVERMNGAKVIRKTVNVQELSNKQSMKTTRITV